MCTVTYIPSENSGFIFTSNRDETPKRSATGLVVEAKDTKQLLFPRDPLANGTWIAVSDTGQLVCILNGAFQKHAHRPPYRLSRGIMALDFFDYSHSDDFFENYEFQGIEPFTMIIYAAEVLYEFRWDESQKHVKRLDVNKKHLWASCTLYDATWQAKRLNWFANWQRNNQVPDQNSVLDFHKNGGEGNPEYDVVMNRGNQVRTTSITSVVKEQQQIGMRYEDVLTGAVEKAVLLQAPRGLKRDG